MTALIAIIAFASMLVLSFTRRGIIILCVFYFSFGFLTVVNDDSFPLLGGFKLYRVAYPLLFLAVLVRLFRDREFLSSARAWPYSSYLALLFLTVISSFHSPNTKVFSFNDPAGLFGILIIMFLFCISASLIYGTDDTRIFAWTVVALSFVLSAWILWTGSQGDFADFRGGTNVNENYESLFVLMGAFPVINFLFLVKKKSSKAVLIAGLFSIALAAFILASRGTIIAAVLGVLAMLVGLARKVTRRSLVLTAMMLAVICGGAMLLPGGGNIVSAFQAVEVETLDDRTVIWGQSIQHFKEAGPFQIFFGDGLSSSYNIIPSMIPEVENYHNVYLLWLMEQGLVGLALFLLFLYRVWRLVSLSDSSSKDLMVGWFVFLVIVGLSGTISGEHSFWIIMGVLCGTAAISKPNRGQSPHNVVVLQRISPAAT